MHKNLIMQSTNKILGQSNVVGKLEYLVGTLASLVVPWVLPTRLPTSPLQELLHNKCFEVKHPVRGITYGSTP